MATPTPTTAAAPPAASTPPANAAAVAAQLAAATAANVADAAAQREREQQAAQQQLAALQQQLRGENDELAKRKLAQQQQEAELKKQQQQVAAAAAQQQKALEQERAALKLQSDELAKMRDDLAKERADAERLLHEHVEALAAKEAAHIAHMQRLGEEHAQLQTRLANTRKEMDASLPPVSDVLRAMAGWTGQRVCVAVVLDMGLRRSKEHFALACHTVVQLVQSLSERFHYTLLGFDVDSGQDMTPQEPLLAVESGSASELIALVNAMRDQRNKESGPAAGAVGADAEQQRPSDLVDGLQQFGRVLMGRPPFDAALLVLVTGAQGCESGVLDGALAQALSAGKRTQRATLVVGVGCRAPQPALDAVATARGRGRVVHVNNRSDTYQFSASNSLDELRVTIKELRRNAQSVQLKVSCDVAVSSFVVLSRKPEGWEPLLGSPVAATGDNAAIVHVPVTGGQHAVGVRVHAVSLDGMQGPVQEYDSSMGSSQYATAAAERVALQKFCFGWAPPRDRAEALGVLKARIAFLGWFGSGKSRLATSLLTALSGVYAEYLVCANAPGPVTMGVNETDHILHSMNVLCSFRISDCFGIESSGGNVRTQLVPTLQGKDSSQIKNMPASSSNAAGNKECVIDSDEIAHQLQVVPADTREMIYGVVLVVDARTVNVAADAKLAVQHESLKAVVPLYHALVKEAHYRPLVAVTHLDRLTRDAKAGEQRSTRLESLHDDELTLGDVELEPTWVAVRAKLANLFGTTESNFYPVLPVMRDRDDVKQVLVLRLLADLLRTRVTPRLDEQYNKLQLLGTQVGGAAAAQAVEVTVALGTAGGEWVGVPVPKRAWNNMAEFKKHICNQIGKPESQVGNVLRVRHNSGQTINVALGWLAKLVPSDTLILEHLAPNGGKQ